MKTLSRPLWQGRFATRSAARSVAPPPSPLVPLRPETFHAARQLLVGLPAHHTYLLGCMEQFGPRLFHGAHSWIGLRASGTGSRLDGVAYIGRTTHIAWVGDPLDAPVDALAPLLTSTAASTRVQAIVGPELPVTRLVRAATSVSRERVDGPEWTVVDRGTQLVMQVTASTLTAFARSAALVPSECQDLPALIGADSAMIVDEIGVDTVANALDDYWDASFHRVADRRTWSIRGPDGQLGFKADVAALSSEAAIIAGVFTAPATRRQGLARAGVGELCHYLLRSVPRVLLAVYADNTPAIALYRSLGFRVVDRARSVWFV